MYHIRCLGCGAGNYVFCSCPEGLPERAGVHLDACKMADPDGQVTCAPGSGCCTTDHAGDPHRRGHALLHCPVDHTGTPCPHPPGQCSMHASVKAHWDAMAAHQAAAAPHERLEATPVPVVPDACPGGHHGLGVDGCHVCRTLTITAVPGYTTVQAVSA